MNTDTTPASFPHTVIYGIAFVNLTPHAIVFKDENGEDHTIPPSGQVARIGMYSAPAYETYYGSLFTQSTPGRPEGIEAFGEWATAHYATTGQQVMGIVSSLFLDGVEGAGPEHEEWVKCLCAPQTDNTALRNEKGHIVAVRSFRVVDWAEDTFHGPGIGGN